MDSNKEKEALSKVLGATLIWIKQKALQLRSDSMRIISEAGSGPKNSSPEELFRMASLLEEQNRISSQVELIEELINFIKMMTDQVGGGNTLNKFVEAADKEQNQQNEQNQQKPYAGEKIDE